MRVLYESQRSSGRVSREFLDVSDDSLIGRDFTERPGVVSISFTFIDGAEATYTHLDREEKMVRQVER